MAPHHAASARGRRAFLSLTLGSGLLLAACGGGATVTRNPVAPAVSSAPTAADLAIEGSLTGAIQDEYRAEATYQRVLAEHGSVLPFVNIARAEQQHAASIAGLFTSRGLSVPARAWTVDNVPGFASVSEACAAAPEAEIENIALYDRFLADDLPVDVRTVFANNRAASLNNHLPAFTA